MRKIGRISAAVIAMAAMAGALAASAAPVMQSGPPLDGERLSRVGVAPEQVSALMGAIDAAVAKAAQDGLSGAPAQQSIKSYLRTFIAYGLPSTGRMVVRTEAFGGAVVSMVALPELSPGQVTIALDAARRNLVADNQLRSGGDGDIAVRDLLVSLNAEARPRSGGDRGIGGGRGGANPRVTPSCYMRGLPDGCDTRRKLPENATTGQPAADEATDEPEPDAELPPSAPSPPRTAGQG